VPVVDEQAALEQVKHHDKNLSRVHHVEDLAEVYAEFVFHAA
jgi:hypothetical protein